MAGRRAAIILAAAGLALMLGLPAAGSAQPGSGPGLRVVGYYVPYDPTSWLSADQHAQDLDLVDAQWVTVDACGDIGSRDDRTLKRSLEARGVPVFPSLLTSSAWLNQRLLDDDTVLAHTIDQIVDYVTSEDYAGFDLDLEGIDPADRDAYTAFVARLGAALHGRGKTLTLAVPAKGSDVRTGWSGAYDYAALGGLADAITIMAYDAHGAWGEPGAVAPYDWVEQVLAFATSQMPPPKVRLGLAFYGYDWNLASGQTRSLSYSQAARLADRYQASPRLDATTRSVTFEYQAPASDGPLAVPQPSRPAHDVAQRATPPCAEQAAAPTPRPTSTPKPPASPDEVQQHVVWIEEGASAAARLDLANRYGAGGVAAWRLGLEDPQVWPAIARWARGRDEALAR
jgi:spore germination protein